MRRRKSDLHARVNRNLPLEFDDVRLTSYAGLELLERYLRTRRFNQLVREAFADLRRGGDFGVVVMVRVFRSGPRIVDSVLSEISTGFQAAVFTATCSKYTASGVRRSSAV